MRKHRFKADCPVCGDRVDVRAQQFVSCWPYYAYFSVKFTCLRCDAAFVFSMHDQRRRYEQERWWVQAWPSKCRLCDKGIKLLRASLRYKPVR